MVITQRECKLAGEFKNSPVWKIPRGVFRTWQRALGPNIVTASPVELQKCRYACAGGNNIMCIFIIFWVLPVRILSQKLMNVAQRYVSSDESGAVRGRTWQHHSLTRVGIKYWWGRGFFFTSRCFSDDHRVRHTCAALKRWSLRSLCLHLWC